MLLHSFKRRGWLALDARTQDQSAPLPCSPSPLGKMRAVTFGQVQKVSGNMPFVPAHFSNVHKRHWVLSTVPGGAARGGINDNHVGPSHISIKAFQ